MVLLYYNNIIMINNKYSHVLNEINSLNDDIIHLNSIKEKVKKGEFTSLEDELFLGKLIYNSCPWNYPEKVGGKTFKPRSEYEPITKSIIIKAETAKNILAQVYERMVHKQANTYINSTKGHIKPSDVEEVKMNGYKGLAIALSKYDYRKGFKFSSYLNWYLFRDVFRDSTGLTRIVSVPPDTVRKLLRVNKRLNSGENLQESLKKEKLSNYDYEKLIQADRSYSSLDMIVDDNSTTLLDVCQNNATNPINDFTPVDSSTDYLNRADLANSISKAIKCLDDDEQKIIKLIYCDGELSDTRGEKILGLSSFKYKKLKKRALYKMKNALKLNSEEEYL